jgi:hypothetical protein
VIVAKAIIHIGMDKTSSTFIQDICSHIRPRLAALGICYPVPRDAAAINHIDFAKAHGFGSRVPTIDAHSDRAWDAMAEAVPDARQSLFLSSENFSHAKSGATIGRLQVWLTTHGYDDVRIIVFLRNQVSWLVSAYGQDIKGGGKRSFAEFYLRRMRRLVYSNLLRAWTSAFGQDNVIAINYDAAREADRPRGIVDALWSVIGIAPASRAALVPHRPIRDNAQSPQVLLEALRRCPLGQALLQQGHNFAAGMLGRSRGVGPQPVQDMRVWPLPPAFLADLPMMQHDNDAVARAFRLPPLPDLHAAARNYQASVVPVPEREVARCASLVMLGARTLTRCNAHIAAPPGMSMTA